MNAELVYPIGGIFTTCLSSHDAACFYIAPYQRGYKWGSSKVTDPVPILLNDLKEAFNKAQANKSKEYYLQYITVKENSYNGKKVLEVIDGQQRLTTISILLSVLHALGIEDNIASNRLAYELRSNFLEQYIYSAEKLKALLALEWDRHTGILINGQPINEQDVYYMFKAAKRIHSFFIGYTQEELVQFYMYLLTYVKVIVNVVEPTVNSEKVFANLNSNKVYLTNAELIKGLLLTKSAREKDELLGKKHFKEILEQRTSMGRQWDEISRMANNEAFRSFFFDTSKSGIEHILYLTVAITDDFYLSPQKASRYQLFNHFHSLISSGKHEKATQYYFKKIREVAAVLQDWYHQDVEIYNLFGFLFFIKHSVYQQLDKKIALLKSLFGKSKANVKAALKQKRKELLQDLDIDALSKEDDSDIHCVFLALSVFDKLKSAAVHNGDIKNEWIKFDFYKFDEQDWDVEHVFPSNPKKVPDNLDIDDIQNLKALFEFIPDSYDATHFKESEDKSEDATRAAYDSVCQLLEHNGNCSITPRQKQIIVKAISLLDIKDSIGNLCLLPAHINRSIGNGMFKAKRKKIIEKISNGHFVPTHTYQVFSKLISPNMEDTLRVWTRHDMNEHRSVIKTKIQLIIND